MRLRFIIIFTLFFSSCLFGGIEKYLKILSNKTGTHQIEGIDFIYMINQDSRKDKFTHAQYQLAPYQVFPYRFSAVNADELPLEVLNSFGVKYRAWMPKDLWGTCYLPENQGKPLYEIMHVPGRHYFSHHLSREAIGVILSHLSVLHDAYESGYNTIWVMEDEIQVIRDPNELSALIAELDVLVGRRNWDILFTDVDAKSEDGAYMPCTGFARKPNFAPRNPKRFLERKIMNDNFIKTGGRYGAYSMIIRKSGIKKLLDFIKRYSLFLPYDMEYYLPNDISLFTVRHDIVTSRIQNEAK